MLKDEEKSSLSSEKEIKVASDVIDLVVQEIEIEKEIPIEVKLILEFVDVMLEKIPHGLPPMRDIQHQIDFIPSSILPKKQAYRLSPKEHEELKMQVDDSLEKGLIQESKIPCVVPALLAPNMDGSIGENAYRLKLLDDYDSSPIFSVKDLRTYHGEDLRANLFSQLWGIDARASTTNLGNSILIMENSDSGVCETLERPNIFLFPSNFESCYYFDLELLYFRKICSPSQSTIFCI